MATKINESVWGTVPATGAAIRTAANTLGTCYNNGTFDPSDITTLDRSIVPWGIGYGGLGGFSILKKARLPIPVEGSSYPKIGTLTTFDIEEFVETNNPVALMMTGNINNPTNANWFSHRITGSVKGSSTAFTSDAAYDKDSSIPTGSSSQYMWQFKPIVYLDYQKVMVQVQAVHLWKIPAGTHIRTTNLSNYPESGYTWEDYELLGFDYEIYYRNASNNWISSGYYTAIPINEKTTSKYILDRYFGQVVRPTKFTPYSFCASVRTTPLSSTGSFTYADSAILREIDIETVGSGSLINTDMHEYGNYINNTQTFEDISYTMSKKCGFTVSGTWIEIVKGGTLPGTENQSVNITSGVYYKINGYEGGSKLDAWTKIIAHEMAFLGLPFQIKLNGDYGTPSSDTSLASAGVYLPIFDIAHMVTTGKYATGSNKAAQINYNWNDIFDSTIPNWDSSYNPPKPSGGGDDDDFGDLTNSRPTRYGTSGTKKYVCSASTINSLQSFLNVSYTPDNTNFIADFKGTNPADYIVSIQRYPFPLPHLSSTASILIGGVDTALTANPLESELYQAQRIFDFGSIAIPEYYGDFRDYESKITLFLPFIGSVELDPRLFIGHLLSIDYIIDYDTGSIAAEIQRDGLTIETKTAHISITVPFFASDMGAYQNSLAQTEFAIEQSKIKQISGIASTAISAGGAIAGAGAGLSDIGGASVAGGLIGGTASMISGLVQMQSLEYQLDHTVPSIGTLSVAAPANAFYMDDRARVLIIRPKMLSDYSAEDYSHTVGNACAIPGKLGNFSGYTVAAAADLSGIPATAAEKAMIRKQLQAGVYV